MIGRFGWGVMAGFVCHVEGRVCSCGGAQEAGLALGQALLPSRGRVSDELLASSVSCRWEGGNESSRTC